MKEAGYKRLGLNFYALRHTFATVAGEARDEVASAALMGHADSSMLAAYREGVSDARLVAVVDVVHRWLYPRTDLTSRS